MFFHYKTKETYAAKLESRLRELERRVCTGSSQITDLKQTVSQLHANLHQHQEKLDAEHSQNHAKLDGLHTVIQKHDMALEDLLDEWSEKKSDEQEIRERFHAYEQQETRLLQLFETFQEHFSSLKRFAGSKDPAWSAQIALMEQTLDQHRRLCGISVIQECGVAVNYDLHEIVEAIDTDDPNLDQKIADIYRLGYIYKGTVKKKAQAAAYRLTNKSHVNQGAQYLQNDKGE